MTKTSPFRWRRALGLVRPTLPVIFFILFASLSVAAVHAVEPLILKRLFDDLEAGRGIEAMTMVLVLFAGLVFVREALQAVATWLTWRTRLRLQHRLLDLSVERLHAMPLSYHQRTGVGATMTRLDRSIQGFIGAFHQVAFNFIPALVYLGLSLYFMLRLNWTLALVVFAFALLPAVIGRFTAPVQTRRERRLLDRWTSIYSRFNEVLAGIVTVKSFAREGAEKRRFLSDVGKANDDVERGVGFDSGVTAAQNLVVGAARISALAIGAILVANDEITLGTLVAFLGYVSGLFGPVTGLTGIYQTVHSASVSLDAILELLDTPELVTDSPSARIAKGLQGNIRFADVRFAYPGAERELLTGINLDIVSGERIAIVGPSGVGKSTLMSLLQRFYDPTAGSITIDGHDLRDLTQQSLRQHIGVVLQDSLLFNDSIRNNIAYGNSEACDVAISEAARHANAHDLIMRLPEGYETLAGERGSRLSVGERQRVAIARALLKDSPILIFDEATSALDAETEALVQEAVDHLTRNRTTFLIAHRLSTVVNADRIIVVRDGAVSEEGSHAQLMAASGYYASLVERQIGGLLLTD